MHSQRLEHTKKFARTFPEGEEQTKKAFLLSSRCLEQASGSPFAVSKGAERASATFLAGPQGMEQASATFLTDSQGMEQASAIFLARSKCIERTTKVIINDLKKQENDFFSDDVAKATGDTSFNSPGLIPEQWIPPSITLLFIAGTKEHKKRLVNLLSNIIH